MLEITKEKVLEAAEKCSQAKETLKTLFPEVFEDDNYFDLGKPYEKIYENEILEIRISDSNDFPEMKGHAFYLFPNRIWELKQLGSNTYLIPTKK